MKGLVHIRFGERNIIFESSRQGFPHGVDQSQYVVAFTEGVHDDAEGQHVIDLSEIEILILHLFVNAVEVLVSSSDIRTDIRLFQRL